MNALAGRIRLDFRSDEPIFQQIVRQIQALVGEGTLKPGDQLPTVRELAIDLRINFSTVARAYRILDEQRLISTQRGRGTYIEAPGRGEVQEDLAGAPDNHAEIKENRAASYGAGDLASARTPADAGKLAELARRFIHEAAQAGASFEQIEQAFRQQLEGWQRDHPVETGRQTGHHFGG